ncbi:MAG: DUF2812 domain-containing protein [Eubacterium sp.]|nr:DUF2812 domain-containing protein [Eubacterium sp.]
MKKVIHKAFFIWNFDKEERWLNEMAAKGLALTSVGFCRYEFEDCAPGEYKICLQFLENSFKSIDNTKYIEFLEETGAEHISTFNRWAYFRKKTYGEDFQLFSDTSSRIKYLTRIIRFTMLLFILNLYWGCYNMYWCFSQDFKGNFIGIINLILAVFILIGMINLFRKRKKLKKEQQIFE